MDIIYLTGTGFGFHAMAAPVAVQQYFDKRRSTATGILLAGNSVGSFIWPPLVERLIQMYTWRGALVIQSAIYLNGFVIAGLLRPFPQREVKPSLSVDGGLPSKIDAEVVMLPPDTIDQDAGNVHETLSSLHVDKTNSLPMTATRPYPEVTSLQSNHYQNTVTSRGCKSKLRTFSLVTGLSLMKDPVFFLLCLGTFCLQIGHMGVVSFLPLRGVTVWATKEKAALLASIFGAFGGMGRICMGVIGDRISGKRALLSGVAGLVTGAMSIMSVWLPSYTSIACFAALYGAIGGELHITQLCN